MNTTPSTGDQWADDRERLQPFEDRLFDALWGTQAAYRRYVKGKNGQDLLRAWVELQKYERLASPRLHRRLNYTMPATAHLSAAHRNRIKAYAARMGAKLLVVKSFARSGDLPHIRKALQMKVPVLSGRVRVEHDRMNQLSALQFARVATGATPTRHDTAGNAYRLTSRTAVFVFVAATLGASCQTVGRAWKDAIKGADGDPHGWRALDAAVAAALKARADASSATQPKPLTPKHPRATPKKPADWRRE